jgi:diguanylate cyclase (GGDEF)-like protein/PAS domain S-box-containing protein
VDDGRVPAPGPRARPLRAVAWCGALAFAVGVAALAARVLGWRTLALDLPGWPETSIAAAPGIAFAGIAVALLGRGRGALATATAPVAAGVALMSPSPHGVVALCAISAGVLLAAVRGSAASRLVRCLALAALGIAAAALSGLVLGVEALYGTGSNDQMSELTALALVALGCGLLVWTTAGTGGRLPLTPVVVTIGLVATVVATCSSAEHAQRTAEVELASLTALAAAELEAVTEQAIARLDDMAVGVGAARDPEHGAFDVLAGRILPETPFTGIGYVLRVPHGRVDDFSRKRGVPITERTLAGRSRPAPPRSVHLPAVRAAGAHMGMYAAGVDSLSRFPWIARTPGQADATRLTRSTLPLDLPRPAGRSTLLVSPVGGSGYIVGVLPFAAIASRMRERLPGVRFALRDEMAEPGGAGARWSSRPVDVGGRRWNLLVERPAAATARTVAVALFALLVTLVMGLASRLGTKRERHAEAARLAAEERSRRLAETSTDMLAVVDEDGLIAYLSPACRELLGVEPATLLGSRPRDLMHPDDLPQVAAAFGDAAAGAERLTVTLRLRHADGEYVWVEIRMRVLRDAAGRALEAHGSVRDISDRMAAKTAIEEAEARFRSTFEEAPIGMAITAPDGRFLRVNRALARLLGHPSAALEGRHVSVFTHADDRAADAGAMAAMVAGESDSYRAEKRYLHASGETVWAALSSTIVRRDDGTPQYFLSQMQDVTERRRHEAELRHLADHDPLTGLLNRRSFERELERHVALVERYGSRGAAMVLDLDHFKTINDTLGHGVGDELIGRVAGALRGRLRESDVLARLGGDEFAVLLPEGGREEAVEVALSVLEAVRGQAVLASSGRARRVSASIGIALFAPGRRMSGDAVLVEADLAMYEAKEAGRDRYAVAEGGGVDGALGARISWADRIRDALAEDGFVLHAQPIVDVASGRTGQYELLLRMIDLDGELIPPGAFLPVAERFDLIGEIDRWVVRRALAMLAEAGAAGHDITVEVNLSGRSTGDPELLALIERELRATGVDPARLIFEITETTAVANIPAAQEFAARLAELGCRFALDARPKAGDEAAGRGRGAGFGSFYYLKHLPFDYLKIDGEFVRHCATDPTDQLVIQAVVDIARGLGKRTVAEQAGDEATLALLRELGVDQAQGYFLGRPAPLDEWLDRLPAPCGHSRSASPAPL